MALSRSQHNSNLDATQQAIARQKQRDREAAAFRFLVEYRCYTLENSNINSTQDRWAVFDIDDELLASGPSALEAVEAAINAVLRNPS